MVGPTYCLYICASLLGFESLTGFRKYVRVRFVLYCETCIICSCQGSKLYKHKENLNTVVSSDKFEFPVPVGGHILLHDMRYSTVYAV